MPKELPGFYYDAGKNRCFPSKGPIPSSSSISPSVPPLSEHKQGVNFCRSTITVIAPHNINAVICLLKYVTDLLKETCQATFKPASTPIEPNIKLEKVEEDAAIDKGIYQRLVDIVIYLSLTRVGIISLFIQDPKEVHLQAVYRVLQYLKETLGKEDFYLHLRGIKSGELLFKNRCMKSTPSAVCWSRIRVQSSALHKTIGSSYPHAQSNQE